MTETQKLRALALMMAPTAFNTNEAAARFMSILDRLGELMSLGEFEAFCERL